jgi:hypothetical protein
MKNLITALTLSLIIISSTIAQTAIFDNFLVVSDSAGGIQTLHFGLDTAATDGIDPYIGEASLPPLPPNGVFDARFNLPGGTESSLKDYREGDSFFKGEIIHEIQYQVGEGTIIQISWDLPADSSIKGRLQDVVVGNLIDVPMNGTGSYAVTNPGAFNKLKMTIIYFDTTLVGIRSTTHENLLPNRSRLEQNYPNPFNPSTTIKYSVSNEQLVTIKIYNALGNEVATLVNEIKPTGVHQVNFDATKLSSGIYFCKLCTGEFEDIKKMILLR